MTDPQSHAGEHALEPVALIAQSGAALRVGRLMLAAGTASYRVKEAMSAVAGALGATRHTAAVSLTEITATTHRGPIFRTEVAEIRHLGVNSHRIAMLDRMHRELPANATVADVHVRLDRIEATPALYRPLFNALFAGAACAGFAVLNNARALEVLAVFVAATLGQGLRRALAHRSLNPFGTTMLAAALACATYLAFVGIYHLAGAGVSVHASGYIACVLFLLPGFPLITGALDLAKLDFSAGVSRMIFATMMTVGAALSVWSLTLVSDLDTAVREPVALGLAAHLGLTAAASLVGVVGFALMFNSPLTMALAAGAIGMVANTVRRALIDQGMVVQAATVVACVIVGVLAAAFARGVKAPHITLSVPAVLVMIPGVTAFQSVVSLNEGRAADSVAAMLEVALIILSILVGLMIAKLLTDRSWAFEAG